DVDGARAARGGTADAPVPLLGVPRARLPAGSTDGELEGGPPEERRPAGAVRPRDRPERAARRRRRSPAGGGGGRALPRDRQDRVDSLAGPRSEADARYGAEAGGTRRFVACSKAYANP